MALLWGSMIRVSSAALFNLRPADATLGMKPGYDVYLYPGSGTVDGKVGDHILMAPAYNVTRADIELLANTTTRTVVDFFAKR